MPALVVEGGAMRAVYATGVLASLAAAGLRPDAIYGTSAGGALAAWYAAGQMERGVHTWDHIRDPRLMSYRRALLGGPVLDLGILYKHYYPEVFGMDVAAIRRAPFPVHVTLTDADTCETYHPDLRHEDSPLEVVQAGASLPLVSDAPVPWRGRRCLDGGTTVPIPLQKAIDDGHKHIVTILNRPPGVRAPEPEWVVRLIARKFPGIEKAARSHHEYHNVAVKLAESPPAGVRVDIIRPERDTGVGRMTRDLRLLRRAIESGRRDGAQAAQRVMEKAAPTPGV